MKERKKERKTIMPVFQEDVVEALRTVHDPEIPINVYDLGLIYDIAIAADDVVAIKMTLTTPNCPEAQTIPAKVQQAVRQFAPGVKRVDVQIVWNPPWTRARMSEDARLALGF
jgi:FeS assembly SUF system protein